MARGVVAVKLVANAGSAGDARRTCKEEVDLMEELDLARGIFGVEGVLGEAEARTVEVLGSLGPALKGLNSQDGVSFEAREDRDTETFESRRIFVRSLSESVLDWEWMEDWEGEVLKGVVVIRITLRGESSGGRSAMMRRGLSSIGGIFPDTTDDRCEVSMERLSDL